MAILEARNITYYYQDGSKKRVILDDVNESFEQGVFYTILGESGSGKTTFLSLVGALDTPKSGSLLLNGQDIKKIGLENYRRNHIGIVFQNYNLIPYLTGIENILVAMSITNHKYETDKKKFAYELIDLMGISHETANRRVSRLSGGEQQRIAIARALCTEAEIILADEPTGNLDRDNSEGIIKQFKQLAHRLNKCVIVVTHDAEAAKQSDVILHLDSRTHKFRKEVLRYNV